MPNKTPIPGTKKEHTRRKKAISAKEKKFAEFMVYEKMGAIEAYRLAFNVDCEPKSAAAQKAQNLAKAQRVIKEKFKLATQLEQEVVSQQALMDTSDIEFDTLRQFIYRRLQTIRDDPNAPGSSRYKAIAALEKMVDPAADVNLIMMWVDLVWRASMAHCPCCHETFPMKEIKNEKLKKFREDVEIDADENAETLFDRRMTVISRADNRKKPHPGQVIALAAPERNIAGLGAARAGKSYLLALFALLAFLIPGVEIWILARIYADAASEVEYLEKFLNTLFFPYTKHIITKRFDSKTEELTLESKWGSVLKVKSAKAKGSISGRELELALIAEPGWVPDDIYNHLRARMTSRLGRTILLGTPQGFGGILGRFTQMVGRDERGRQRRIPPSERTIEAGCPWNISLLQYSLTPDQNPEYVSSELAAAKSELTDAEYASEFEGIMASSEGAIFPALSARNLVQIPRASQEECAYVLGIDQGPKNFAACLLGYDTEKVWVVNEYFDNTQRMMKAKMEEVMDLVPGWIRQVGGDPKKWALTIFDVDPPLLNELSALEDEGNEWPTEYTFRIKDKKGRWNQENWRRETYEFINRLSQSSPCKLYFDEIHCDFLHDQLMRAQSTGSDGKGWNITDAVRQDHVADAFVMAMFTILSGSLVISDREFRVDDAWDDAKKAALYRLREAEKRELSGMTGKIETSDKTFERTFGRKRRKGNSMVPGSRWNYKDY
ncbi:MAG: terminase family protein [Candidatus Bathyarchaeota archaeon]|nr:terminase family protein [Candidatus Bathyarchaeota archaeon]